MLDPRLVAFLLVAVFAGVLVLRVVAARQPSLRRRANIASLLLVVILVAVIGFVVASVVGALGQALSR